MQFVTKFYKYIYTLNFCQLKCYNVVTDIGPLVRRVLTAKLFSAHIRPADNNIYIYHKHITHRPNHAI